MSSANAYPWSCRGKKRIRSKAQAERIAKRQRRRYCEVIIAYFCPCCRAWHTGNSPKGN